MLPSCVSLIAQLAAQMLPSCVSLIAQLAAQMLSSWLGLTTQLAAQMLSSCVSLIAQLAVFTKLNLISQFQNECLHSEHSKDELSVAPVLPVYQYELPRGLHSFLSPTSYNSLYKYPTKDAPGSAQSVKWETYRLDDRGIVVWFPEEAIDFRLL